MTEIKDCLPEGSRKHFIDLRNVRLERETGKYTDRLRELRSRNAFGNQVRSGVQEMQEWKYKEELWHSLAKGYVEDAFETCRLYDIELTRTLCDCLVKATTDLLETEYRQALQAQGQGLADVKVPLSVRQQSNLGSRGVMSQIRVMLETERVEDEKKRVAVENLSRANESTSIHIHNSNVTTVGEIKSEDTKEKGRWNRGEKIAAVAVAVTIVIGLFFPEIRRLLRLEKPAPAPMSLTQAQAPQSELPAPAIPNPSPAQKQTRLHTTTKGRVHRPLAHPLSSTPPRGSINQGAGSALSINQQGGITAGTIIGTPPCQWNLLTDRDFAKIAQPLASSPAKIYIAIPPSNNDAARFAGYLQAALKTISRWNADDFDMAIFPFWAKYPGITVIAHDQNDFSDLTKPAAQLKNAIQSLNLTVHTQRVASLSKEDDLGLWVNTCE
jgi:hypothetical protein